jgi:DNA-binding MarR family transcriptional regulator
MNDTEEIIDLMHKLSSKIQNREKRPNDFGTGDILYRFEIHVINAIYKNPQTTVSELSKILCVTKGAISQIISKLIRKDFITRVKDPVSNKKIYLTVTQKGTFIAERHIMFHKKMIAEMAGMLGDNKKETIALFLKFLRTLDSKL